MLIALKRAGGVLIKKNKKALEKLFEAEGRGLALLAGTKAVRVPEFVGQFVDKSHAYLVLEYIDMGRLGDPAAVGEQLAAMHQITSKSFDLDHDNFIGLTKQKNTPHDDWVVFYRNQRLGFQAELLKAKGHKELDEKVAALQKNGQGRFLPIIALAQACCMVIYGAAIYRVTKTVLV